MKSCSAIALMEFAVQSGISTHVPAFINMSCLSNDCHSHKASPTNRVSSFNSSEERQYSVTMTNLAGTTNSITWKVRALNQGGVAAWGSDSQGQLDWPVNATNVIGVAAGGGHSLAVREDGSVLGWGLNDSGQTNAPALTNAIAVAAGNKHSLALRDNGTVVRGGDHQRKTLFHLGPVSHGDRAHCG